jgi:dTDP-glucose 4,6-dehydratase
VGRDDALVHYARAEPFTTKTKRIDCTKAMRDLEHDPKTAPEEGIRKTVAWMKQYYGKADK